MAQVRESRRTWMGRCLLYARQRPVALGVGAIVAVLVAVAVGAGVTGALGSTGGKDSGVLITRSGAETSGRDAKDLGRGDAIAGVGYSRADAESDDPIVIVVDVAGAVGAPSLVTLQEGARVGDAIEAAGGFAADADAARVNRAAKLQDGQQVYGPRVGEAGGVGAAGPGVDATAPDTTSDGGPVNINLAGEADLDALPGVGPSTARAIVEDREANGPFSTIEDLMRVSGIGEKKFEKLKSSICV